MITGAHDSMVLVATRSSSQPTIGIAAAATRPVTVNMLAAVCRSSPWDARMPVFSTCSAVSSIEWEQSVAAMT